MSAQSTQPGTVSVVVATYNQAQYLPACLDALVFQDYPALEILVVNDGCTDDTAAVIADWLRGFEHDEASYASFYDAHRDAIERRTHPRYPRKGRTIRVIDHGMNRGLAPALNTGMRAATGEYVTYVPSDDVCFPGMIADLAAPLLANEADFTYADMYIVDDAGRILRRFSLPDYSFERCFGDWYLCGVVKLYRRELHEACGFYDETLLAHDHELFQRFAMYGARFHHVPKALMAVRDHGRGRQVDIHAPSNWTRLLQESKELTRQARDYLRRREAGQD